MKEEPTSPPPSSLSTSPETRRRPAPMLLNSTTNKNIGLAILSPGLPPRATTDPDSRKQLVEADAIRAQQLALIDQRRNQQNKPSATPGTPATAKRTPKTLSQNHRSTKRARAPPNITIDSSAGKSNPDISIQSAPLYPPRGTLFNKPNGDSGPMTSALYHQKETSSFPYSIPSRRPPSDPIRPGDWEMRPPLFRPSPPRLPSLTAQFNHIPHPPPTPQTPTGSDHTHPTKLARNWIEGRSIRPRRAKSDVSSSDDEGPVTIQMEDSVTLTKMEWLQRGHDLLERAWHDMVNQTKEKQQNLLHMQQQQQQQQNHSAGQTR